MLFPAHPLAWNMIEAHLLLKREQIGVLGFHNQNMWLAANAKKYSCSNCSSWSPMLQLSATQTCAICWVGLSWVETSVGFSSSSYSRKPALDVSTWSLKLQLFVQVCRGSSHNSTEDGSKLWRLTTAGSMSFQRAASSEELLRNLRKNQDGKILIMLSSS